MGSLMDEISRDYASANGLKAVNRKLRDDNCRLQREAYEYLRMARRRRRMAMQAISSSVLARNLMFASVAINVVMAVVIGIMCAGVSR